MSDIGLTYWVDGFQGWSIVQADERYDSSSLSGATLSVPSYGLPIQHPSSVALNMGATSHYIHQLVPDYPTTSVRIRSAFRTRAGALEVSDTWRNVWSVWNTTIEECALRYNPTQGAFQFYLSSDVPVGPTASVDLSADWWHIEVSIRVSNTAGEIELYIDGQEAINLSGLDTQFANPQANEFRLHGYNIPCSYLDYLVWVGSAITPLMPTIYTLVPQNSGLAQHTPLSGTNVEAVDDGVPGGNDSDGSYNSTTLNGDRDTFTVDLVDLVDDTHVVATNHVVKVVDTASGTLGSWPTMRDPIGLIVATDQTYNPDTSYETQQKPWRYAEVLGASELWTRDHVNNLEFGYTSGFFEP